MSDQSLFIARLLVSNRAFFIQNQERHLGIKVKILTKPTLLSNFSYARLDYNINKIRY